MSPRRLCAVNRTIAFSMVSALIECGSSLWDSMFTIVFPVGVNIISSYSYFKTFSPGFIQGSVASNGQVYSSNWYEGWDYEGIYLFVANHATTFYRILMSYHGETSMKHAIFFHNCCFFCRTLLDISNHFIIPLFCAFTLNVVRSSIFQLKSNDFEDPCGVTLPYYCSFHCFAQFSALQLYLLGLLHVLYLCVPL